MKTLRLLYPVELTAIILVSITAAFLIVSSVWKKRAKARGTHSYEAEIHFIIGLALPMIFLFFYLDVIMYHLGADISPERLKDFFRIFLTGVAWSIYFGFVVPKVFRFDYARLAPENLPSQNPLWGGLIFALAALWTVLFLGFFSDEIVLCMFNMTWLSEVFADEIANGIACQILRKEEF